LEFGSSPTVTRKLSDCLCARFSLRRLHTCFFDLESIAKARMAEKTENFGYDVLHNQFQS
jgi:hypothetical protein